MLVSGSTAPTTYKQGYTGIHNFAWTGVKVEGENIFDASTIRYGYYGGGTSSEPTNYSSQYISVAPSTTYYISGTIGTYHLVQCFDVNKTFISTLINNNSTRTFTTPNNAYYIVYSANVGNGRNVPSTIMISKGNSAPSDYVPYITPTTTAIDLSSILYNGSPLFEGNSLKAVNDIKDSMTPYKATKKIGTQTNLTVASLSSGLSNTTNSFYSVAKPSGRDTSVASSSAYYFCDKFDFKNQQNNDLTDTSLQYKIVPNLNSDYNYLCLPTSLNYTVEQAQALLNGATILYPLATYQEADIDFSQLVKFEAYSNGSITLVNTNNQDTTSTFKYLKEVAE